MSAAHRPSILHRPLRSEASKATAENLDAAYQAEQEHWASKATRAQATQDRLLRSIYPTGESKALAAEEVKQALDQHYRAKEQQRMAQAHQEAVWVSPGGAPREAQGEGGSPWRETTYTQYASKIDEDAARRAMAATVAEDNLVMMHQRAVTKMEATEAERHMARMTVMDESSFWNMGVTNDRWLQPDRKRSPRGASFSPTTGAAAPPPHASAPYAQSGWEQAPGAGAAAAAAAAASQAQPPYAAAPYAQAGWEAPGAAEAKAAAYAAEQVACMEAYMRRTAEGQQQQHQAYDHVGQYDQQQQQQHVSAADASAWHGALSPPQRVQTQPQEYAYAAPAYTHASPTSSAYPSRPQAAASATASQSVRFASRPQSRGVPWATSDGQGGAGGTVPHGYYAATGGGGAAAASAAHLQQSQSQRFAARPDEAARGAPWAVGGVSDDAGAGGGGGQRVARYGPGSEQAYAGGGQQHHATATARPPSSHAMTQQQQAQQAARPWATGDAALARTGALLQSQSQRFAARPPAADVPWGTDPVHGSRPASAAQSRQSVYPY
ncbi:hypothetical protein FOA52_004725 [Chlamydomonas sp. UWO 241]|nr:hypothetical protein FOA52_004725 [Chlamydomonas sp. UWO 241]